MNIVNEIYENKSVVDSNNIEITLMMILSQNMNI